MTFVAASMGNRNSKSRLGNLRKIYRESQWRKDGTNLYDITHHLSVILASPILAQRDLDSTEYAIVYRNIEKHREIIRIFFVILFFSIWQLHDLSDNSVFLVSMFSIPIIIVTGVAWFTISVGAVKPALFDTVLDMTKWIFVGLISGLTIFVVAAAQTLPWFVSAMLTVVSFFVVFCPGPI